MRFMFCARLTMGCGDFGPDGGRMRLKACRYRPSPIALQEAELTMYGTDLGALKN